MKELIDKLTEVSESNGRYKEQVKQLQTQLHICREELQDKEDIIKSYEIINKVGE